MLRIFALFVALAVPVASLAQTPRGSIEIDDVRGNARFHAGPLYATPMLLLKEFGIDSNVFNETGEQKSDFTFTLAPKADIWVPVARRALLKGMVATDLVWYREYDAERSVDPQLSLRGEFYLNRVTLFAERSYLSTRERPNFEIDSRSRRVEDTLTAGAEFTLTPTMSLEVAGHRLDTRYDSGAEFDGTSLQRILDRERSGLQLTARRRLTALTSVSVRYETFLDRFTYSPMRDSHSYGVLPGVEFQPRALINGSAYVGYREFTPEVTTALPEFRGLVAQLGLSYTLLGATTFGVAYNRDLSYSYLELQPFFVDNSIGVSIRRALGSRFDALVSADRHKYEYRDAITDGGLVAAAPRTDMTWNVAGSVGYRLGRDGRVAFGVSYWQRESTTGPLRDYDNLRVGSTISYGF
jgi:hypothetical protein